MDKFLAPAPLTAGANLAEQWKRFKKAFNQFLRATERNAAADPVKVALLLRTVGDRGNDIYETFTYADGQTDQQYNLVITKFDAFCRPRVNIVVQRHLLLTLKQGSLSVDEFVTALHKIARDCDLAGQYDQWVLQALLLGIEGERLRRRLFEQAAPLTLEQAINFCRSAEAAATDIKTLRTEETVQAVHNKSKRRVKSHVSVGTQQNTNACGNCGSEHLPRKCKAYGQQCHKCKKFNHFARFCKSRSSKVNMVSGSGESVVGSDSDSEDSLLCVQVERRGRRLIASLSVSISSDPNTIKDVEFQLDSAASCNVLTTADHSKIGSPPLKTSRTTLRMYDDRLTTPIGCCTLMVEGKKLLFQVMESSNHSLLSMDACLEMGLLRYKTECVSMVTDDPLHGVLEKFDEVFRGIGQLPGEYALEVDPTVRPVQNRPRKVPIAMQKDVKAKVAALVEKGILSRVDHPTDWISNMQPVRKPNGTIRLCIDPANLNKALKRNHFPMPAIEDVLPELDKAKIFSLCDAKDGFLQVKLADSTSDLTTFWTPYGRYKWNRMPFGISTAPEEFQRRLSNALGGLPGIQVVADDILIYGKGATVEEARKDHDGNLVGLLKRALEFGLRLNKAKCRFLMTELPYIGHVLTPEGVKPDPNKISAIRGMVEPKDSEGVRRFLGHMNYLSKFIPNLSAESEPLRRMLNIPDQEFRWAADQQRAFENLKSLTTQEEVLQYFDPLKPVVVQTDASAVGLGAVMLQEGRPVAYASRSLNKSEPNYAPLELECLAIVFATGRFDQYLFGHPDVTVYTDHRPLESILNKSLLKAPKRLQAMMLALQRYTLKVVYKPGIEQVTADLLSRSPLCGNAPPDSILREHVFQLAEEEVLADSFTASHHTTDRRVTDNRYTAIRKATPSDPVLLALGETVSAGWPRHLSDVPECVRTFWNYRDEIATLDGILYKGERIIVPASLRRDVLERLHAGHQGVAATLSRARTAVFWPSMKDDIKRTVEACQSCQLDAPQLQKEPLMSHSVPKTPWYKVGVDILSYKGVNYLVFVDYMSDFIDFEALPDMTAVSVIKVCKHLFARLGIPVQVHSDNGPQFSSGEFLDFAAAWEFQHTTSSAYYSQSNGKAESAVKIVKRLLKRSNDPRLGLLEYLNTPTSSMSTSPAQRLLGRPTRSVVPQLMTSVADQDNQLVSMEKAKKRLAIQRQYDKAAVELDPVREGQPVLVRDFASHKRRWREAKVVGKLSDRSYTLSADGMLLRRNRRHIRPFFNPVSEPSPVSLPNTPSHEERHPTVSPDSTLPTVSSDSTHAYTDAKSNNLPETIPSNVAERVNTPEIRTRSGRLVRRPLRYRE